MSEEEKEIEKPKEIVDIVEKILEFNILQKIETWQLSVRVWRRERRKGTT